MRDKKGRFIKGSIPITAFKKGQTSWNKGRRKYNYICLNCKKLFSTSTKGRKYCNYNCYKKINFGKNAANWQGGQVKRICFTCGKIFYIDSNVIKRGYGKFCSRSCLRKRKYGKKPLAPKKELYCIICDKKFYEYVSHLLNEKNRGKCCSKECRVKYTQQRISGSRNYRWKGGITKPNLLLRYQMKARNWSKAIKIRDNFTCRLCGDRSYKGRGKTIKLHSHHIKTWKDYPELRYDLNNGITVCFDCHLKILKKIISDEVIYKAIKNKQNLSEACLNMLKGNNV